MTTNEIKEDVIMYHKDAIISKFERDARIECLKAIEGLKNKNDIGLEDLSTTVCKYVERIIEMYSYSVKHFTYITLEVDDTIPDDYDDFMSEIQGSYWIVRDLLTSYLEKYTKEVIK